MIDNSILPFYSFLTGNLVPVLALVDAQHPCPKGDDQYQRDVHITSMVDGLTFHPSEAAMLLVKLRGSHDVSVPLCPEGDDVLDFCELLDAHVLLAEHLCALVVGYEVARHLVHLYHATVGEVLSHHPLSVMYGLHLWQFHHHDASVLQDVAAYALRLVGVAPLGVETDGVEHRLLCHMEDLHRLLAHLLGRVYSLFHILFCLDFHYFEYLCGRNVLRNR